MSNFELSDHEVAVIKRLARLDELLIQHPAMVLALKGIKRCIAQSKEYKEPVGCMLLAEGGMGKSSICKIIQAGMPSGVVQTNEAEITLVPAFRAEVPSTVSVSYLASNILEALNDPNPTAGTIPAMTKRISVLLRKCGTIIIFLDECQNLLNSSGRGTASANLIALRWLKSLVNNCGICICLSGTPESEAIIDSDLTHQLSRRFKYRFKLDTLQIGTKNEPGSLYHFLNALGNCICKEFGVSHLPFIGNYEAGLKIYAATRGNLAYVMTLIKDVLQHVWLHGGSAVTLDDFAFVWDSGVLKQTSISKQNPFRLKDSELAAVFRGRK